MVIPGKSMQREILYLGTKCIEFGDPKRLCYSVTDDLAEADTLSAGEY